MQPGTIWYIGGVLVIALGSVIGGLMIWKANLVNSDYKADQSKSEFKAIITDQKNQLLSNFNGIQILEEKIEDIEKGYLRIKIHTDYLNSNFSTPVTLKNSYDKYQPISVLCDSDPKRGPGIIIVMPNKEFRTTFYLTDFIQFRNLGKLIYVEDFVFEVFYNEISVYFVTSSGAMKFEPTPETGTIIKEGVRLGPNLISRPFDETSYDLASSKFSDIADYFGKDYSDVLPHLYKMKNFNHKK